MLHARISVLAFGSQLAQALNRFSIPGEMCKNQHIYPDVLLRVWQVIRYNVYLSENAYGHGRQYLGNVSVGIYEPLLLVSFRVLRARDDMVQQDSLKFHSC